MEALIAKVITLFVVIILSLGFSVLPYFLVLRGSRSIIATSRREKVIALLNCFAGGVFLGTLLLHLMTEGSAEFEEYKSKSGLKTEFPLFNLFMAGGFFSVGFIEIFMHSRMDRKSDPTKHIHNDTAPQRRASVFAGQYGAVGDHMPKVDGFQANFPVGANGNKACSEHHDEAFLQKDVATDSDIIHSESGVSDGTALINQEDEICERTHVKTTTTSMKSGYVDIESEAMSGVSTMIADLPGGLQAFLLLIALSFHTIFDGLAVGLQKSVSGVWQVFMAIAIHKSIIAFCLGLELFKCQSPCRAFAWMCFFSIMSPIGIGLGIVLTSGEINELARLLSSSILQGMAAGTFLYVTFLEILSAYMGRNCHGKFQHVCFAMVGFSFMAFVKLMDRD